MSTKKESSKKKTKAQNLLLSTMARLNMKSTVSLKEIEASITKLKGTKEDTRDDVPADIRSSRRFMRSDVKRFHGVKASINWFPRRFSRSRCRNRFGYLTKGKTRRTSKLQMNPVNIALLNQLGDLMGNSGREAGIGDSNIPAGYTYFGQFVDHDITFDVSSSIDQTTRADRVNNMRTPALDLDSVYGDGPALHPFLYDFPTGSPSTAIKMKLGANRNTGPGGPGGSAGAGGMQIQTDFDVPRINGTNTAVIGDPRNDENLIVSQFHHAMLKFHNQVVDLLVLANFNGDIFVEAKKIVTHHYQWAVVHDFLRRICGDDAVDQALHSVKVHPGTRVNMPVEFSVGAYRFGHSMIRDTYWLNFNFINQPLSDAFSFVRNPNLPVLSNWVIDFNSFFETGVSVPIFNMARKIDSVLSSGLEALPGGSGIMAILATRNLRRGMAFGLPSGQATATEMGIQPLTQAQIESGLPNAEVQLLRSQGNRLLKKTPLWYYILRESAVLNNGDQLGPVGAKIIADTFVRILKADANSFLNQTTPFVPFLPAKVVDNFSVSDLIVFSGANQP